MYKLEELGWGKLWEEKFSTHLSNGFLPGRIAVENKNNYLVYFEGGETLAENSGRLIFMSDDPSALPKVGDWVAIQKFDGSNAIIHEVLERKTKLSRKVADKNYSEQVLVTNIDFVFIVQSLDSNYNFNRLERYLVTVFESGAEPIIVLSKSDLCDSVDSKVEEIQRAYPKVAVVTTSSITETGIDKLEGFLEAGKSHVFLGSSGVGKSTLINKLFDEDKIKTGDVRISDGKGKHTTTKRELIVLPGKGMLIDTPGMRGLQLWSANGGIEKTFDEFEEIAEKCRFTDCTHTHETGCAVIEAVEEGSIPESRYENYLKLRKELRYLETKIDYNARMEEKKKWMEIKQSYRKYFKGKKGN
ncbi:MAG: ribosome small subunit-dependent GTPase A [Melioribacteraceae bacterium]|nr:ribosome small subunit-dependent GTPase A [Melioribacteraceae bacterium]MCF8263890.1 ribosome small subunit-dependent GTPase A [Melioribacteraceae bacterium]MCF8414366.1 ribosome small subunit-dependent GTPase A [Melioribacteraceae bacterium]MCF8430295.1 ribosome small subunit-dependent GTPase A [Melioribacteraceae bacterium]